MTHDASHSPKHFPGVTISSTFTDLKEHRAALIEIIKASGLTDIAMENDAAKLVDVIESSLQMVRDGSAYIGVIGKKYGQVPKCPRRNPENLSITELEFNEAMRLGRPILLFIMGEKHLVLEADIESNARKKRKLKSFRERAKKMSVDSDVERIYAVFENLEDFKGKAATSVGELRRHLEKYLTVPQQPPGDTKPSDPIPKPPTFYPEPPYLGSHRFVGRQAQLDVLNDWALPADPHNLLLFDAIGGNGKSMLTWEWANNHAPKVRTDWAGRFWYSFYERGALMADFCHHALAYITGRPLEDFHKKKTTELTEQLLHHLRAKPWLFILDGLERVLVAYHRIDAAEVLDDEVNQPTDKIVNRDPCTAIRPEDDDLLRLLASAKPSKILVSSRLVPKVLLNQASQPIPGVQRIALTGLRPPDAEALLLTCGVRGKSEAIQKYLTSECDCHPLVIGVLAGLINNYHPDRGNFDAWLADGAGGGQLNLANLDLIQKRNHILDAGLKALSPKSRQLLLRMALLPEAVDFPTLCALNPHLPPEPEKVDEPRNPELEWLWKNMSEVKKGIAREAYQTALIRRQEYEDAVKAWRQSPEHLAAPSELKNSISDLERRGLLQYDGGSRRYDLHPVVRGVASGGLRQEEKEQHGQCVVDYFSAKAHNPYEEAESLEDLRDGLHIVRTLLKMNRFQEAYNAFETDLGDALFSNVEAYVEILLLLRPFFLKDWDVLPVTVDMSDRANLANTVALALAQTRHYEEALAAYGAAISTNLEHYLFNANVNLYNIATNLMRANRVTKGTYFFKLGLELALLRGCEDGVFKSRYFLLESYAVFGWWAEAEETWLVLDKMGRNWSRKRYRQGDAELQYARFKFLKGDLDEKWIINAEELAQKGRSRLTIRNLHLLRGEWHLDQDNWALAVQSLQEAVRMAREIGQINSVAETLLALARFRLGQLANPRQEVEQLSQANKPAHLPLAELWLAIGDREQAKKHALAAYKWAWADGEPYVRRYELNKATALLLQLGVEVPKLPAYNPANDPKFPWEDKLNVVIERLRAEKAAEEAKKN